MIHHISILFIRGYLFVLLSLKNLSLIADAAAAAATTTTTTTLAPSVNVSINNRTRTTCFTPSRINLIKCVLL